MPGISTSRSRGIDITLIVDDFALRRMSSIVSVRASLNGVSGRWSEPMSRIVCGLPGGGAWIFLEWIGVLTEISLTSVFTSSRPATAVVAAPQPTTITAATAMRVIIPALLLGIRKPIGDAG